MIFKKKGRLAVVTTFLLSLAAMKSALADSKQVKEPLKFNIDKGTVKVKFVEMDHDYEFSYVKVRDCQSEVKELRSGANVKIFHDGAYCPSGQIIELKIKDNASCEITLAGGVIEVSDSNRLVRKLNKISAIVSGGVATSEVSAIKTSGYAPSRAEYTAREDENRVGELTIYNSGGVVSFMK